MPRINLIGSSNLYTNNTCAYGSMAGLPPTTNVRPNVTGLAGYKVGLTAGNQHYNRKIGGSLKIPANGTSRDAGCGLGKSCADGAACLKYLNLWTGPNTLGSFHTGRTRLLH